MDIPLWFPHQMPYYPLHFSYIARMCRLFYSHWRCLAPLWVVERHVWHRTSVVALRSRLSREERGNAPEIVETCGNLDFLRFCSVVIACFGFCSGASPVATCILQSARHGVCCSAVMPHARVDQICCSVRHGLFDVAKDLWWQIGLAFVHCCTKPAKIARKVRCPSVHWTATSLQELEWVWDGVVWTCRRNRCRCLGTLFCLWGVRLLETQLVSSKVPLGVPWQRVVRLALNMSWRGSLRRCADAEATASGAYLPRMTMQFWSNLYWKCFSSSQPEYPSFFF